MSTQYKFHNPQGIYFITFAVVEWIDVFSRMEYRDILVQSIRHCQENKGLNLHAWVIMSNHVHLVASVKENNKLGFVLRDMKKWTSVEIVNAIENNPQESRKRWMLWLFRSNGEENPQNVNHQFWQQDNHPIELYSEDVMRQKMDYVHNNPVRAGIVDYPEDYLYSSARDYAGEKGLLELELLY